MRRVAAKFVPKMLNCDQKQHRMNIANEMLTLSATTQICSRGVERSIRNITLQVMRNLREAIRQKPPDLWKNKIGFCTTITPLLTHRCFARLFGQKQHTNDVAATVFPDWPPEKRLEIHEISGLTHYNEQLVYKTFTTLLLDETCVFKYLKIFKAIDKMREEVLNSTDNG
ncbi:hypothetical protein LAZ67_21001644 [Cordylochernes scorpioides]|uniref:Uncharacterized protein n=1 Tax=Cordylochernes scorpioides TaxID=51811 RepID=A0ABY6LML9_9ARAC|nr:hypothetical protein LAZ67_21001644 [Cordylochernes scorpioides]